MGNYNFRQDLSIGRESEEMILNLIKERTLDICGTCVNRTDKCDIHILFNCGKRTLIEVKTDMQAHETGNVALEIWCRGHDSGILTTESDYIVYVFEDNGVKKKYIYRSKTLREYCLKNRHRAIQAGDLWINPEFPWRRKSSDIILVKKTDFIKMGRDMDMVKTFKFAIRK